MITDSSLIRDILNVRKSDFFCSYGLNKASRGVVNYMCLHADVSCGVAVDNVEYEESTNLPTVIYRDMKEVEAKKLFDRVYSDFENFPRSKRNIKDTFQACYDLVAVNGMVLITGLSDWLSVTDMLKRKGITKYWYMRETEIRFDVLYKKTRHYE